MVSHLVHSCSETKSFPGRSAKSWRERERERERERDMQTERRIVRDADSKRERERERERDVDREKERKRERGWEWESVKQENWGASKELLGGAGIWTNGEKKWAEKTQREEKFSDKKEPYTHHNSALPKDLLRHRSSCRRHKNNSLGVFYIVKSFLVSTINVSVDLYAK